MSLELLELLQIVDVREDVFLVEGEIVGNRDSVNRQLLKHFLDLELLATEVRFNGWQGCPRVV